MSVILKNGIISSKQFDKNGKKNLKMKCKKKINSDRHLELEV